jgi:hypothetical protein
MTHTCLTPPGKGLGGRSVLQHGAEEMPISCEWHIFDAQTALCAPKPPPHPRYKMILPRSEESLPPCDGMS